MRRPSGRYAPVLPAVLLLALSIALSACGSSQGAATPDPASGGSTTGTGQPRQQAVQTRFGTAAPFRLPGESLAQSIDRQRHKYGGLGIVRLFYTGLPDSWGTIEAADVRAPVSVSFKISPSGVLAGKYDAFFTNWFSQAPTDRRTFWTYYHEPEDNIRAGEFTAADYRAAWKHLSDIAAEARNGYLQATLVLTCWTLDPRSGRDWRDYYPAKSVQLLAWDCYNDDWRTRGYQSPASLLAAAARTSRASGLPWAVAELGSIVIPGDDGSGRARWLSAVVKYAAAHGARFVVYFDIDQNGDYRLLDRPSVQAWASAVTSQ